MWCAGFYSLFSYLYPQYLVHSDPLDLAQAIGQAGLFFKEVISVFIVQMRLYVPLKIKSLLN